jgi:hypothetical protein
MAGGEYLHPLFHALSFVEEMSVPRISAQGTLLSRMASHIKTSLAACLLAAALTYASLAVPGSVSAICANLGTPTYCPVLAYGFPLPFIADSQAVSPVGSVTRDPLSLLTGLDEVLWPQLAITSLFWLFVVVTGRLAWLRLQCKRNRR